MVAGYIDMMEELVKGMIVAKLCEEMDKDIFVDYFPAEPDECIALIEYAGTGIAMYTDTSVRSVQVTCRGRNLYDTQQKCWKVFDYFNTHDNILRLPNCTVLVGLRQTPFRMSQDDKGRERWVFNMGITFTYKAWQAQ